MPNKTKVRPDDFNGIVIPYDASFNELRAMLCAPPPQCWVAFIALGYRPGGESLRVLAEQLSSPDTHFRRAAVGAIATHPDGRELERDILERLKDPSDQVVREACNTAASLGLRSAHDIIISLLDSSADSTRIAAITALSDLWEDGDFQRLFTLYRREQEEIVRKEAAWVLRDRVGKKNWRELFDCFLADEIPRHRTWACELAGAFGMTDVEKVIQELLNDQDGHVRRAAHDAIDRLKESANSPTPQV
ncbi:MAG: HEAT repeat domain-containing protein [Candidatus Hydrogenedentes bacterium]|nr:HEAT repeat domain-containing protein [Candidatus Hydrogenedentota bacterium]